MDNNDKETETKGARELRVLLGDHETINILVRDATKSVEKVENFFRELNKPEFFGAIVDYVITLYGQNAFHSADTCSQKYAGLDMMKAEVNKAETKLNEEYSGHK